MPTLPIAARPLRPARVAVLITAVLLGLGGLALPSVGRADEPLSWSFPQPITTPGVADVSQVACPSTSLCVAVDGFYGDVATSTDPTGGAGTWTVVNIAGRRGNPASALTGLACPSVALCVAVDGDGDVLTATNPGGGAGAWTTAQIDAGHELSGIACPSVSLCVAVDTTGNVLTSSNPTGGAVAWSLTNIDHAELTAVTCPTSSLCIAVDAAGNVLTSTDPTAANSWQTASIDSGNVHFGSGLTAIACPSTSLCVAVDSVGNALTATNPGGGAAAWTTTDIDGSQDLGGVACPSVALCVATGRFSGQAISSTNPTGGANAWTPVQADQSNSRGLSGIACPSLSLCVAVNFQGVVTTTEPTGEASAWTTTPLHGLTQITGLACPSTSLCAAVDSSGDVLTSVDPTTTPSVWSTASVDAGGSGLNAIACPSTSLCVASDSSGDVLTSTNPVGGTGAWTTTAIAGQGYIPSVSCPTTSFCAATGIFGEILISTNPTGGAGAWQVVSGVDSGNSLTSIACPSVALCVAVDSSGHVVTSTNPTGGAGAWTTTNVDGSTFIRSVACASAQLCVAVDSKNVLTSTNPTGGAGAWDVTPIDSNNFLEDVACPATNFCVAVSGFGTAYTSTNPTGGAAAWTNTGTIDFYEYGLDRITCASISFCLAADQSGDIMVGTGSAAGSGEPPQNTTPPTITGTPIQGQTLTETHGTWSNTPTSYTIQWQRCDAQGTNCTAIAGATGPTYALTPADVGSTIRVQETASNEAGPGAPALSTPSAVIQGVEVVVSPIEHKESGGGPQNQPPPLVVSCCDGPAQLSVAQLTALLSAQLVPPSKGLSIVSLLNHGGLSLSFKAPEAGSLSIQWFAQAAGATSAKQTKVKAKPLLIATGSASFPSAGVGTVRVRLTKVGLKLLKPSKGKRLRVEVRGRFVASGSGEAIGASKGVVVNPSAHVSRARGVRTIRLAISKPKPGFSVTGPFTEVSLYTKYTYTVGIVSRKSYRHASVSFSVSPSDCFIRRSISLKAYRPWQGQYTIEFVTTNEMSNGIGASVFGVDAKGTHLLFSKSYVVTPLPGQVSQYPPPSGGTPCPHKTPVGI